MPRYLTLVGNDRARKQKMPPRTVSAAIQGKAAVDAAGSCL
jgi:hypothetical protein